MFKLMLQKMWHKRWMTLSLLVGCVLLVATAISFPLYQKAAYDRMLQDEFHKNISEEGRFPTVLSMATISKKDESGMLQQMETFMDSVYGQLGASKEQTVFYYILQKTPLYSDMNREDAGDIGVALSGITDFENHVNIINGECFSETGKNEQGAIEVLVCEDCFIEEGLLLGETLTYEAVNDAEGKPIQIEIKGVFRLPEDDLFWQEGTDKIRHRAYMNINLFRQMFTGENTGNYTIDCRQYAFMDYQKIVFEDVKNIVAKTKYFCEESEYKNILEKPQYMDTMEQYLRKINRISATLLILQVPVMVMLCAFLLMISGQMYEMERNEISVIKSRGSYRSQIFRLYLYQGLVLSLTGGGLGTLLGVLFSKMLSSTRNFLEIEPSLALEIVFTQKAVAYAAGAMLLTLLSITLPAIKHSRVSIVDVKRQKATLKKSLWKKLYLDVILIGISVYGYYSFHKNMTNLSLNVLQGESLDPLLYISSSLFILGCGLLFLRIQPMLVLLIYKLGKRFWKSASYISFLENMRNAGKQQLIMLFLIMTVSLGIYHATVARTILSNAIENTQYLNGSEIVIKEAWPKNLLTDEYMEPDYTKYMTLPAANLCTRVLYDDAGYVSFEQSERQTVTVMGIHTKEFGMATQIPEGLLKKPYYEYLNALAKTADGVIASSNFQTRYGYKVGDTIRFRNEEGAESYGRIVDFVDYWPGYTPKMSVTDPDGSIKEQDNFLLVAHYEVLKQDFGIYPYEVWIDLKEEYTEADFLQWVEENHMVVSKYANRDANLRNTMEDPLLQGTNGILTLGFMVTILLCAIGYLIYWIMAIRERELMFGVLRACGFHKGELVHMLINEQIFCGVFSVLAGIGIGSLSSKLFVPILQQAYASENQVLPMKLITNAADMYRLYGVIAAVMLLALSILIMILFKMNVTKALKLGEE